MSGRAHSFPYRISIEVPFRDLDAMGHVNNAVYFSYLETARIKFLVDLLAVTSLHDLPVIMAEATCTLKRAAIIATRRTMAGALCLPTVFLAIQALASAIAFDSAIRAA